MTVIQDVGSLGEVNTAKSRSSHDSIILLIAVNNSLGDGKEKLANDRFDHLDSCCRKMRAYGKNFIGFRAQ